MRQMQLIKNGDDLENNDAKKQTKTSHKKGIVNNDKKIEYINETN